ncbi:MAG: 4Fe-4S binding protein [Clostridia bacterium]|nr:4Fe-4S binding protein [Clostridia bacterium]
MKYLDVATLSFEKEKCIGCKRCLEVCPHQVFEMREGIELSHKDKCIECGACQMNCPASAITVKVGTGCASAVIKDYLKRFKSVRRFLKDKCC